MLLYYLIMIVRALVVLVFAFATLIALTHWAVRNGHLQPFNGFATGVRRLGEPLLKPLERRVLASGGNPVNAPYYLFWASLLGGLAVVALVQWLVATIFTLTSAATYGPRGLLLLGLNAVFSILMLAIFIRVIASWFSISPYSRPMRIVHGLTDWLIDPLRKVIPPLGMIDIVPMVAYFMLYLARGFVLSLI